TSMPCSRTLLTLMEAILWPGAMREAPWALARLMSPRPVGSVELGKSLMLVSLREYKRDSWPRIVVNALGSQTHTTLEPPRRRVCCWHRRQKRYVASWWQAIEGKGRFATALAASKLISCSDSFWM